MARDQLFKPGQSGNPKGKPKGAKNKVKRLNVSQILESMNYEPFAELVNLARNARSEKVRCDAAIELCNYVAPKMRQVEFKNDSEAPFIISLNMSPNSKITESISVQPNVLNDDSEDEQDEKEV